VSFLRVFILLEILLRVLQKHYLIMIKMEALKAFEFCIAIGAAGILTYAAYRFVKGIFDALTD
jgi:hypothetical protein